MGSTITPIATTAPAPNIDEKHAVVTTQSRIQVSAGLSPPSSVVVRIRVEAIPVFIRTRPNHAPKMTFTSVAPLKRLFQCLNPANTYRIFISRNEIRVGSECISDHWEYCPDDAHHENA